MYTVTSLNRRRAPSTSSQPRLPDPRTMSPDRHLANLVTRTKGDVRLSLPGLRVRNWALDRREPACSEAISFSAHALRKTMLEGRMYRGILPCPGHVLRAIFRSCTIRHAGDCRGGILICYRSTATTAISGSDKIPGTIHPVHQSYRDVTRGWPFTSIVILML